MCSIINISVKTNKIWSTVFWKKFNIRFILILMQFCRQCMQTFVFRFQLSDTEILLSANHWQYVTMSRLTFFTFVQKYTFFFMSSKKATFLWFDFKFNYTSTNLIMEFVLQLLCPNEKKLKIYCLIQTFCNFVIYTYQNMTDHFPFKPIYGAPDSQSFNLRMFWLLGSVSGSRHTFDSGWACKEGTGSSAKKWGKLFKNNSVATLCMM